jgi:hypothetical protein
MTQFALDGSEPETKKTALLSDCGLYRYELQRVWQQGKPLLVTCMLNPSTADADNDDPTIRTLLHFGRTWGYGGLLVVNLFAFRSSSPREMMSHPTPRGPKNEQTVNSALTFARSQNRPALAAWGANGAHHAGPTDLEGGQDWLCRLARHHTVDLVCLGTTRDGFPKHPMARGVHRIDRSQQPVMFRRATEAA